MNKQKATELLTKNILPFWQSLKDTNHGGFYGEADFYGKPNKSADKGGIMTARILWTFAAAYRELGSEEYKHYAEEAYNFMLKAFLDKENGGLYWLAQADGKPLDVKKQFYNIAFGIYALSEYYHATGEEKLLKLSMELYNVLEKHGRDLDTGGYIEACGKAWEPIDDYRLSDKDLNAPKSMNTNLHVLEAYTNLLRAGKDEYVKEALRSLVRVTLDKIISNKKTFLLFFEMDWTHIEAGISYGHDIEGSWLLYDAAVALGDAELIKEAKDVALTIANATYDLAIDHENGGLLSGRNAAGELLSKKEWWPQAEAVVGFYNAYELSGDEKFKTVAESIWEYALGNFVDAENGEWHNELFTDNRPDTSMPKSGFWKCPYHNGRMCLEVVRRL